MSESELKEIENQIKWSLENCACLGRDAYGQYIDNLTAGIINKIKSKQS
jgi:hypothetical protein